MTRIATTQYRFNGGNFSGQASGNVDSQFYKNSLQDSLNFYVTAYGTARTRSGTKYIANAKSNSLTGRLFKYEVSASSGYVLEFCNSKIRFYKDRAQILSGGSPYELNSPYSTSELADVQALQTTSGLFLFHKDYAPRLIVNNGSDTSWTISTATLTDGPYLDENTSTITITPSGTTGSITLTASTSMFTASDVGRLVRLKSGPRLGTDSQVIYVGDGSQTTFDIPFYPQTSNDLTVYLISSAGAKTSLTYTAGAPGAGQYTISSSQVTVSTAPTASEKLEIRKANAGSGEWGYCTITGYTSGTQVSATVNRTLQGTNATTYWRLGALYSANYPISGALHEERLVFLLPSGRICGSVSGSYLNFQPDTSAYLGDPSDASAYSYVIAAIGNNRPKWIYSFRFLLVGTEGQMFAIISNTGGITPLNVPSIVTQGNNDASNIRPVDYNSNIFYINKSKDRIYNAQYDINTGGFDPKYTSYYAEHLFRTNTVVDAVRQGYPDDLLWFLLSDGTLASLTFYDRSNLYADTVAFMPHALAGTNAVVESIITVPTETRSELYMFVSRTVNGSTIRTIEVLEAPFLDQELTDCRPYDAYVEYSGGSTSTLSGLTHLEGETVKVIVDGERQGDKVVSGGSITLDKAGTNITAGLYRTAYLKTNNLIIETPDSSRADLKTIYKVDVELYQTAAGSLGVSSTNNFDLIFETPTTDGTIQEYNLYTGHKDATIDSNFDQDAYVYIENDSGMPCTINSLTIFANLQTRLAGR